MFAAILSLILKLLSLYLGLTTSLFTLSFFGSSTSSFYGRLLMSYLALTLCAFYGVLASLALRLVGAHHSAQWATARAFKYTMALFIGVRFEILSGKKYLETRPAVFVGNHQTALDVLLLGEIFPKHCSVTAKKSLKSVPFLGWFMALSGTVFIDRADRQRALKAFEGAAEVMRRKKQSVFIFPEGTRSNAEEPMLLGFKKGAFHLAIQAKVPIVPVVAGCYWGILGAKERRFRAGRIPVVGTLSGFTHYPIPPCFASKSQKESGRIYADHRLSNTVLPPIPTDNLTPADVDELTKYTRDVMLRALVTLTNSPLGQRAANPALEPNTDPAPPLERANIGNQVSQESGWNEARAAEREVKAQRTGAEAGTALRPQL